MRDHPIYELVTLYWIYRTRILSSSLITTDLDMNLSVQVNRWLYTVIWSSQLTTGTVSCLLKGNGVVKTSTNNTEPTQLTRETYDRLQGELEDLTTRGRVEIAQAIESARALGDLSENGDYHAAKDSQGKMESRIRHLQALLKTAVVVENGQAGKRDGTVTHGSVVTLRYEGDDDDDTQQYFVGSIEERRGDLPIASPNAPLGQALLGKRQGDSVEYESPGGKLKVEIVKIEE